MFGQAIHLPENRTPLLVPARPAPRGRCVCHVAFRLLLRCVTEVHIHLALSNRTRHKLSFHSIWNCSRSTGTSPPQPRSPLSFAAARISAGGPSFVPVFVNAASNPHAPSASICAAPRASEHGARCIMATAKLARRRSCNRSCGYRRPPLLPLPATVMIVIRALRREGVGERERAAGFGDRRIFPRYNIMKDY